MQKIEAKRPVTEVIDVKATKLVLHRMFNVTDINGIDGKTIVFFALQRFSNFLCEECYMKAPYFSEEVGEPKKRINSWLSLNDKRLPGTYEKYLLLSRLFNCNVDDIVRFESSEGDVSCDNDLCLTVDSCRNENDSIEYSIRLPRIRERLREGHWQDRFVNYSDKEIELDDKLKSKDGLMLSDRIKKYYDSRGLKTNEIPQIIEYLNKHVINSWKDGRYLIGMEMLATFSKMTGIRYRDLYKEVNELIKFSVSQEENIDMLRTRPFNFSKEVGAIINEYLSSNKLVVYKESFDYLITRTKSGNRFGLITQNNGMLSYLPAVHDCVVKCGDHVYAILDNKVTAIKPQSFERLEVSESATPSFLKKRIYSLALEATKALVAVKCDGLLCFKDEKGQIVAMCSDSVLRKVRVERDERLGGDTLILNRNGIEYFGFLDEKGSFIPPIYEEPLLYGEDLFVAKKNGKYGYLNKLGFMVIKPSFEDASIFSEGLAVVRLKGKYGFINTSGKLVIENSYDFACDFHEGLACVTKGKKDGYVDKKGNLVIMPQFDCAFRFSEGIAAIKQDDRYGYIDKRGSIKIRPIYEAVTTCKNGKINVVSAGNLIEKQIS